MRYHFKENENCLPLYGEIYICDHPVYNRCTLFKIEEKGLAVIQQRYDKKTKRTWWSEIDLCLNNTLYLHPGFKNYFNKKAKPEENGLYPTVTIRQIMWALKIKPIQRQRWETVFDRQDI